jgi:uncharacterized membrane protein YbhN (UPF0104 family)
MAALQRIAFRAERLGPVLTSQLASGAFGRVVPGGGAASAAFQYGLLSRAGVPGAAIGGGLTATSLLTFAVLLALPVLALPGIVAGRDVPSGLAPVLWLGLGLFVLLGGLGALLLTNEAVVRFVGRMLERAHNAVLRWRDPVVGLPDRLARERAVILRVLGERWWEALLFSVGKWILDFLTLVTALIAVGAQPPLTLVLLAYCASLVLAQIPATPGGLGFVEAGLTGTLALAGVGGGDAVLATLIYRLFSYWLYLPAGLGAWIVHVRVYELPSSARTASTSAP